MTILEGLRCAAEELEKIPVAGMEQRDRINHCTKLIRLMIESLERKEEATDGGSHDPAGERETEGAAGTV